MAKSRRAAALKGWRTRERNAQKRSEAAKKGWRTRKAKKQPPKKQPPKKQPPKKQPPKKQPPKKQPRQEYVVHFDYKGKKRGHAVTAQVHLTGPAGASDESAIFNAGSFMAGKRLQKGWEARVISWRGNSENARTQKGRDAAEALLVATLGSAKVR